METNIHMEDKVEKNAFYVFLFLVCTVILIWLIILYHFFLFFFPFMKKIFKKLFFLPNLLYIFYKIYTILIYVSEKNIYLSTFAILFLKFFKSLINFYGFKNLCENNKKKKAKIWISDPKKAEIQI